MPLVTYGSGGSFDETPPPVLFPRIRDYAGDDQYRYVMERLAQLAGYDRDERGDLSKARPSELFLTDIFRGPAHIRDAVGLSLQGRVIDPETRMHRATEDQDFELVSAVRGTKVRVRCIDGRADSIRFKRGVRPDPRGRALRPGQGVGLDHADGVLFRSSMAANVDEIVDYQAREADLPVLDAWIALGRHGKECRTADSARLQERYWLFEEVRPEQKPEGEEPRRKR